MASAVWIRWVRGTARARSGQAIRAVAAVGAACLLGACTTIIVPPASVADPQPVFVLEHGRHTSLVLPHPDGLVRYAYGDWDWYAERTTGPAQAARAIFQPSRAGLGRKVMSGAPTERGVRQSVIVGIEKLHPVRVETGAVIALRESLDRIFEANRESLMYNEAYDLAFVPHPEPYEFSHNSNHQVAQWLDQLGCTIKGSAYWAQWRVVQP